MNGVQFDDILDDVGGFGMYQIMMFFILGLAAFVGAETIFLNFIGYTPDHWCNVAEKTVYLLIEDYKTNGEIQYDSCRVYEFNYSQHDIDDLLNLNRSIDITNSTTIVDCPSGWVYDQSVIQQSIVTKWNLVCADAWMVPFVGTMSIFGYMIGSIIVGPISDRYGRWYGLIIFQVVKVVSAFLSAFAPNYPTLIVARILLSIGFIGNFVLAFTLLQELAGPAYRTASGVGFHVVHGLGMALVPGIAYFLRDDVTVQIAMAGMECILPLAMWFVPESPRWLILNNRHKEADKILRKMARFNGRELPEDFDVQHIALRIDGQNNASVMDIAKSPVLRRRTLILCLHWFTDSLIYLALTLNAAALSGNIYLNTFLLTIIDVPANIIAMFLMNWERVGRRFTACLSLSIAGFASLISVPIIITGASPTAVTILSLFGKGGAAMGFACIFVYTAEIFPTEIRSLGIGICSSVSRVSGMAAPFAGGPLSEVWLPLPSTLFGTFGIFAGFVSILLPETLGKNLPDTIKDVESKQSSKTQNCYLRAFGDDKAANGSDQHGFPLKL